MSQFADVRRAAAEYVSWDPCEETRSEVAAALARCEGQEQEQQEQQEQGCGSGEEALGRLMLHRQTFGTAGLRGPMCAGYAGLNYLVVLQTTQGLIAYLRDVVGEAALSQVSSIASSSACDERSVIIQGVVIGYDHRRRGSMCSIGFAQLCARVFIATGFKVRSSTTCA